MMNPMLMQLLQQQQQMPQPILGQEIDAQSFGGPGFLGQVDAQPQVGAAQAGQAMDPQMLQAMMRMGQGMQQPQQPQQQPPPQMPMPQSRQTTAMPDQAAMMQMLARRGGMPSITGPLGRGF